MLSFPNAKINLGLNVVARRLDGYHDIESCFYPIPWCDVLEVIPSQSFRFTSSGLDIPGDMTGNLCVKAYQLLAEIHGIGPVHIHLHKVIPMGAGLGGGSADGAFTLKVLNELFHLELDNAQLKNLAVQLGSDCPFFIENKPVFATGTGTTFRSINIDLAGKHIALKHPQIHVGTKEAYSKVHPQLPAVSVREILSLPIQDWKGKLQNDFEISVFPKYPQIQKLKDHLYEKGAVYASMSGSGSAVYGIFEEKPEMEGWILFEL